ncbi:MAG: family 1 glycosylhydrolase [Chthoniobacteraceae bacterium]
MVNQAYHDAPLTHGYGVSAVREHGVRGASVGMVHNRAGALPLTESDADIAAAKEAFSAEIAQFLSPLFWQLPEKIWGDLTLISQPTDFLGFDLYYGNFIRAGMGGFSWRR